jgi:hypothetical protein
MSSTRELKKRIAKERLRLEEHRKELGELQTKVHRAEAYITGLEEALKFMPVETEEQSLGALRPNSAMDLARRALLKAGHPLHITDLLRAIGRDENDKNKSSVASSIRNYARNGQFFTVAAPNTFGLIEFPSGAQSEPERRHVVRKPIEDEYDPFANE